MRMERLCMGEDAGGALQERSSRAGTRTSVLRLVVATGSLAACAAVAFFNRGVLVQAVHRAAHANWAPLLLLAPMFIAWNYVAALAWRSLLRALSKADAPPAWRLTVIRIQGGAINLFVPLLGLGGDVTRTVLLTRVNRRAAVSAPSVLLDSVVSALAGLIFCVAGMSTRPSVLPGGAAPIAVTAAIAAGIGIALWSAPQLARKGHAALWSRLATLLGPALQVVALSPAPLRSSMRASLAWHFVERCMMAAEVWLIAYGLGLNLTFAQVASSSAVMTAFTIVLFFVPGQLGAPEGGLSLAFLALGLPGDAGLSVALIRRARQVLFSCLALALLAAAQGRSGSRRQLAGAAASRAQ
jgi:hypothetical protein